MSIIKYKTCNSECRIENNKDIRYKNQTLPF